MRYQSFPSEERAPKDTTSCVYFISRNKHFGPCGNRRGQLHFISVFIHSSITPRVSDLQQQHAKPYRKPVLNPMSRARGMPRLPLIPRANKGPTDCGMEEHTASFIDAFRLDAVALGSSISTSVTLAPDG